MAEPQTAAILVLVRDLMFSSRISAEARAAAKNIQMIRDPAKLPEAGELLIVDLNLPGALDAAAIWGNAANRRIVGFVSHVDAETIAAARKSGRIEVMARSQFVKVLPDLLKQDLPT